MGDSIGNLIVTPYITNLLGKDLNRCQMNRLFFWPDMFLGYVLSFFLDKASKGEVSTFTIFLKKKSNTGLFVSLKLHFHFKFVFYQEHEEQVPETNYCLFGR